MRLLCAIAGLAALGHVSAAYAPANHSSGTYTGSHSGGGGIQFVISGGGNLITAFGVNGLRSATCNIDTFFTEYFSGFGIAITSHAFNNSDTSSDFSGSFPSAGTATGTISIHQPNCNTGTLTWQVPADRDGDGIPDSGDSCPTQPGNPPHGCPDSDGDGIPDPSDACPTQPGSTPNGCPPPVQIPINTQTPVAAPSPTIPKGTPATPTKKPLCAGLKGNRLKRCKARAKCKKLKGAKKRRCLKRANRIGRR